MKKIIAALIVVIAAVFFIRAIRFEPVDQMEYEGNVLADQQAEENLMSDDEGTLKDNIPYLKVKPMEQIFEQMGNYFVGEKKKEFYIHYPMYLNDNQALMFLAEDGNLVDCEFEEVPLAKKTILSNGVLYDKFRRCLDENVFLFYRSENDLFFNSKKIKIKSANETRTLPENCMIYFTDTAIRYYEPTKECMVYHTVIGVGKQTTITMDGKSWSYGQFLKKIGRSAKAKTSEDAEENTEDTKETSKTSGNLQEKSGQSADSAQTSGTGNDSGNRGTKQKEENKQKDAKSDGDHSGEDDGDGETSDQSEEVYIAPKVSMEKYSSTIYTVSSRIRIQDPQNRIKKRVTIEVWNNGKVILRKFYKESQDVYLENLPPDSDLTIRAKYTYQNKKGDTEEKSVKEQQIRTRSLDTLKPIRLSFGNGEIFSNYIQIKDLKGIAEPEHEGMKNIGSIQVETEEKKFSLTPAQVVEFINGDPVTLETGKTLKSNTEIDYRIRVYDKFDHELKTENGEGNTRTCKAMPSVTLKVSANKVNHLKLLLSLDNPDQVNLKDYKLRLTSAQYGTVERKLTEEDSELEFQNLPAGALYQFSITAKADLNDKKGEKSYELSKGQFTTASLKELGSLTMITKMDETKIEAHRAQMVFSISQKQTNTQLLELMNRMTLYIKDTDGSRIQTIRFSDTELQSLKNGGEVTKVLENLNSKTRYNFQLKANVVQGNQDHQYDVVNTMTTFQTLREPARVLIREDSEKVTANSFSLDLCIYDPDGAVDSGDASMRVTNRSNEVIGSKAIQVVSKVPSSAADEKVWTTYTMTNIAEEQGTRFFLDFMAKEYNERYTNPYRKVNEPLYLLTNEGIKDRHEILLTRDASAELSILKISDVEDKKEKSRVEYNLKVKNPQNSIENNGTVYVRAYDSDGAYTGQYSRYSGLTEELNEITGSMELNTDREYELQVEAVEKNETKVFASVSVNTKRELTPIRTEAEFYEYTQNKPSGHYIVINSLNLDREVSEEFTGSIDFQGKKVTFSITDQVRCLFRSNKGTLSNVNLYLSMKNQQPILAEAEKEQDIIGAGGLVYTNQKEGVIENLYLTFVSATSQENSGVGGVIYENKGTLEKFVICAQDRLTVSHLGAYGVAKNGGTIKNGYVYGNDNAFLDARPYNPQLLEYELVVGSTETESDMLKAKSYEKRKSVGGLAGINETTGNISRVYSLIQIKNRLTDDKRYRDETSIGTVAGTNMGEISRVYGYDDGTAVYNEKDALQTAKIFGPTVGRNWSETGKSMENKETYFISDRNFTDRKVNVRISKLTVSDYSFHDEILNQDGAFSTRDLVLANYYPHVKLPDYMPSQKMNPLPKLDTNEALALKSQKTVSAEDDEAVIELEINNPGSGDITAVEVKDIKEVQILSQEHKDKVSIVRIRISNPEYYISDYSILNIRAKNNYSGGSAISVAYGEGEKIIDVDFYRPIYSTGDWKKYLTDQYWDGTKTGSKKSDVITENFKLMSDLNFAGIPKDEFTVIKYGGILDGNGHTVKNMTVSSQSGTNAVTGISKNNFWNESGGQSALTYVFPYFDGKMTNITFEGLGGNRLISLVGYLDRYSTDAVLDHVHVKNTELNYGGSSASVVSIMQNRGVVQNCSAVNTSMDLKNAGASSIGGLAGIAYNYSQIRNSFVKNLDLKYSKGTGQGAHVGGLLGYSVGGTIEISDCYADGSVAADDVNVGGFIGTAGAVKVDRCFANVDLEYKVRNKDYLTISGFARTGYVLKNILSVGDMSNRSGKYPEQTEEVVYRISNSSNAVNDRYASKIYGAKFQKINGVIDTSSVKYVKDGLLSYEQLTKEDTYRNTIGLGDCFDYEKVGEGNLPRLLDTHGKLLEDQGNGSSIREKKDIRLSVERVNVIRNDNAAATVELTLENPDKCKITKAEIDGVTVEDMVQSDSSGKGKTVLQLQLRRFKAYDNYLLTGLEYEAENQSRETKKMRLKIPVRFYHEIRSAGDLKSISKNPENPENYRLIDDLDLTDFTGHGYVVNRLEGKKADGSQPSISNLTLKLDGSSTAANEAALFKNIESDFSNVKIKNCHITITNKTGKSVSEYYGGTAANSRVGFAAECRGFVRNIEIDGLTINDPDLTEETKEYKNGEGVGFIGFMDGNMLNVTGKNLQVNGYQYVGGLIGYGSPNMEDVSVTKAEIGGIRYVGGVTGRPMSNGDIRKVLAEDVHVELGETRIQNITNICYGGIVTGAYRVDYATVRNSTLNAVAGAGSETNLGNNCYVGGITGCYGVNYSLIENTKVTVKGNHQAGGLTGIQYGNAVYGNIVKNLTVSAEQLTDQTNKIHTPQRIGLIAGNAAGAIMENVIQNSRVESVGDSVGGMVGYTALNNAAGKYAGNSLSDVTVKGNSAVGGIIGYSEITKGNIIDNLLKVEVEGSGYVGGIVGQYMAPANANGQNEGVIARNIITGTVSSSGYNAGSIFGTYSLQSGKTADLMLKNTGSNILAGLSVSAQASGEPNEGVVIGGSNATTGFAHLLYHSSFKLNGKMAELTTAEHPTVQKVTREQLKTEITYTEGKEYANDKYTAAAHKTNSTWDMTWLAQGYFPHPRSATDRAVLVGAQKDVNRENYYNKIAIPADVSRQKSRMKKTKSGEGSMPKVWIYPSDVDGLNLESERADESVFFTIGDDHTKYPLKEKVQTITWDYQTEFTITMHCGKETKNIEIDPLEYRRKVMSVDGEYYYLSGTDLMGKNGKITSGVLHLNRGKALTKDGVVVDVTAKTKKNAGKNLTVRKEAQPLYVGEYEGSRIQTFGTFSLIDEVLERDMQIFAEKGMLSLTDGTLDVVKDSHMAANYEEKEYQAVLGNDGILYNLKTELVFPEHFSNEGIDYMTAGENGTNHYMMVSYEDGGVCVFDYLTGEILKEEKGDSEISLFAYAMKFFQRGRPLISSDAEKVYQKLVPLKKKLEQHSIAKQEEMESHDKAAGTKTDKKRNSSVSKNKTTFRRDTYTAYYDKQKQEYVLYHADELLDVKTKKAVSENEKIEASKTLTAFYSPPSVKVTIRGRMLPMLFFAGAGMCAVAGVVYLMRKRKKF